MTTLRDILVKVPLLSTSGEMGIEVSGLQFDSRKVEKGHVFVAVKGTQADGHDFIDAAADRGAIAIVSEKTPGKEIGITWIQTDNSARALGIMASNLYGRPSEKLKLVGVTGTNGKTTIVTLLHQLYRKLGYNTGLLSTICNKINDNELPATHTTGDALQINQMLKQMADAGCNYCFMEASSHAIDQERIAGLQFEGGVFTNITHDHLDYHQTFDAYIKVKKKFFDELPVSAFALVNTDDKRGQVMLQNTRARKYTYSVKSVADYKARILSNSMLGLELEINQVKVWFNLIGEFNAYNLTAAYAVAELLGEKPDDILVALSGIPPINGRFELVNLKSRVHAVVDYAHTPDALKNVLETIQGARSKNEQVITVVGCGGNRDKAKRPLMAEIACKYSDKVIFTSDNPRDEDPEDIIAEMKKGVSPSNFRKTLTVVDRREAIKTALMLASEHDIILLAGKGHEEYQEIKGVKRDFSDKKVIAELDSLIINDKTGQG